MSTKEEIEGFCQDIKEFLENVEKYKQDIPEDVLNCFYECSNEEKLNEYINNYEFNYNKYIKDNKETYIHRNITDFKSMIDFMKYIILPTYDDKYPITLTIYFDIIIEYSKNSNVEYKNEIFKFISMKMYNLDEIIDEEFYKYFQNLTNEKHIKFYDAIFCIN